MQDPPSPLVSVIMPVYNVEDFLFEAIDSILEQSYGHFELLIFNDGSTDKSLKIIQSFKDRRIRLYNYHVNTGYVTHLNEGITVSRGKYIARMDADDIAHPNRLKTQVEFLESFPKVGVCGSQVKYIGKYNGESNFPSDHEGIRIALMTYCSLWHPSVMIRKSVLEKHNITYDPYFLYTEDYDLWCKLIKVTEIANLPDVLLSYRKHDGQVSSTKAHLQIEAAHIISKKYLISLGFELSERQAEALSNLRENIGGQTICKSGSQYASILDAMCELRRQNLILNIFDPDKLDRAFEKYWIILTGGIIQYDLSFIMPLVLMRKPFLENISMKERAKGMIKSVIFWKTRI